MRNEKKTEKSIIEKKKRSQNKWNLSSIEKKSPCLFKTLFVKVK